jgi:hypothetical protein
MGALLVLPGEQPRTGRRREGFGHDAKFLPPDVARTDQEVLSAKTGAHVSRRVPPYLQELGKTRTEATEFTEGLTE